MPDRVEIPVAVTGAEQAQQQLAGVAGAVESVGQAGAAAAPGVQQASAATSAQAAAQGQVAGSAPPVVEAQKHLSKELKNTAGSSRELVGALLGRLNPELGALGSLAMRAAEGIKALGAGGAAMLGLGAALAVVSGALQSMAERAARAAEAIKRAEEARQKMRAKDREERGDVAVEAAKVGVFGQGEELRAIVGRLRDETGLGDDLLQSAAIAQVRAGLNVHSTRAFLAGLVANGMKPAEFKGTRDDDKLIRQTISRGMRPDAKEALDALTRDLRPRGQAEAIDDTAEYVKRTFPQLSDEQLKQVLGVARDPDAEIGKIAYLRNLRQMQHAGQIPFIDDLVKNITGIGSPPPDSLQDYSIREIRIMAETAVRRAAARKTEGSSGRLIIQVGGARTTNIGTQYNALPPLRRAMGPTQAEELQTVE